ESKAMGGGSAILPTPAIGGVGLLDDWEKSATIGFKAEGEAICVVGNRAGSGHLGQSLWLRDVQGRTDGPPPPVDVARERAVGTLIRKFIGEGLVTSVHDVSDGGLAVTIAEMALACGIGAEVLLSAPFAGDAFGESQGLYVVTVDMIG